MSESSDEDSYLTPEALKQQVKNAELSFLPEKSREKYLKAYDIFKQWRLANGSITFSETVLLAYFIELSQTKQPSTMWSIYSMLKTTIKTKDDVHIETYHKLIAFLKKISVGHKPKKSKHFSAANIQKFLNEALDCNFLAAKMRYIINRFMELREKYQQMLVDDSSLTMGDVTTINLTKLEGGIQTNIVPEKFTATFDIRLSITTNHELFEAMIKRWCQEAGSGVLCEFEHKDPYVEPTPMDESNRYWIAMKGAIEEMGIPLVRRTMPCTTDARFLRGARALNFSPLRRAAPAPHQRDESLPLPVFVQGIAVYEGILKAVANLK